MIDQLQQQQKNPYIVMWYALNHVTLLNFVFVHKHKSIAKIELDIYWSSNIKEMANIEHIFKSSII